MPEIDPLQPVASVCFAAIETKNPGTRAGVRYAKRAYRSSCLAPPHQADTGEAGAKKRERGGFGDGKPVVG